MSPSLPPLVPKLSPEPSPVITSSPHPSLGHGGSPATNVSPISSMSAGSNSTMNMSCIDPECFQKIEDVSSTSAPSFQVFLCKSFQKDSNNQISKRKFLQKWMRAFDVALLWFDMGIGKQLTIKRGLGVPLDLITHPLAHFVCLEIK